MILPGYTSRLMTADGQNVVVRLIGEADGPGLRAFFESLGHESIERFMPHPYTDDVIARRIERALHGDDLVYVAVADGSIIAYFFLWSVREPVPILGIGIADAWQNCRLGQQFMAILIEEAVNMGKDGIELTTMLDNDRAFHVYEKLGFQYYGDVRNELGTGEIIIERGMFLPLRDGVIRTPRTHECPP